MNTTELTVGDGPIVLEIEYNHNPSDERLGTSEEPPEHAEVTVERVLLLLDWCGVDWLDITDMLSSRQMQEVQEAARAAAEAGEG